MAASAMRALTTGALSDLKVVEYGREVAAPFCARLFADLGAEVIKVEDGAGDRTRQWGSPAKGQSGPDASKMSAAFHYLNAGKRGVTADLDNPTDAAWFDELLAGADVFVEGLEPDERRRWSLGFDDILARHPHLIVVSLSPYGRSGAMADWPGSDLTAAAVSSMMLGLGEPDREPLRLPFDQCDYQAALHAAVATLGALRERESSGLGQGIDISSAQVTGSCVGGMHLVIARLGLGWERRGRLQRGIYPTGFFECKDGFICIASQSPKQWDKFIRIMGEPEWAKPDEARNAMLLGAVDPGPADPHFRAWLMEYTRQELTEIAMREDITLGAVNTVDEILAEPHFSRRSLWGEISLEGSPGTTLRMPKPGYQFSKTPTAIRSGGPAHGTDTDALRAAPPAPIRVRASGNGNRRLPLEGIRILDFGWNWAGPMAAQVLADMGADVIRVETEKRQDLMRLLSAQEWFFCHNNRSKGSITVNVTLPEGAELVRQLVKQCDIVMDNFRAGVMAKNGLGYEDLKAVKPDIIAVSMSMAGQVGPLSGMSGFASIATGFAGLERLVGYEDGMSTGLMSYGLGDVNLAIQGSLGALAALHHRERTGEGQFVDVSQVECSISTLGEPILAHQITGERLGPQQNRHSTWSPHGVFPCLGEDRWIAISIRDAREWSALCGVIGQPGWAGDPELANAAGRMARRAEIDAAITAWCAGLDRDNAVAALVAAGVPAAPLLELVERNEHPHFVERGFMIDHVSETFDDCRIYATPWLFTATPPKMTRPTPRLGEDNDRIFGELLGLTGDEIAKLADAGVIA